jgi:DNA-binding transcriptional regulator YhcF (GntR family)
VTEKLPDVWSTRDFPVLVEITRRIDAGESIDEVEELASSVAMPAETVDRALAALQRRGLIRVVRGIGGWAIVEDISAEAYFLTGLHPSGDDAVSALVTALRQAADQVDDPQEKSRLRALADNALGVGRDVLGGVLVNLATKGMLG